MSPVRLKKILVPCYLEREQLNRLKSLSDKTGAPMTHYLLRGTRDRDVSFLASSTKQSSNLH